MNKRADGKRGVLVRAATKLRAKTVAANVRKLYGKPPSDSFDDNPEWTSDDFARARPASQVHGPEIAAALVRRRGRPAKADAERKEAVSIRLSPDVLAHFRALGPGWQTRIDELLREHVSLTRGTRIGRDATTGAFVSVREAPSGYRTRTKKSPRD